MQWPRAWAIDAGARLEQPGAGALRRGVLAVEILGLAALYFGTALLGFMLGPVNTFAAPVWPPAGISLAALLLRGNRVWPGIALGALSAGKLPPAPRAGCQPDGLRLATARPRPSPRNRPRPLDDLVREVVEDHRTLFASRAVALRLEIEAGPHWVDADPNRLAQVVGNLLQNAAKFSNSHGHVVLEVRRDGRWAAVVRLADEGIGIAPALLPRIFEPFTQADDSLDRGMGGLGLGLSLAKGLIELHGGTIDVRSEGIGRGAEFTIVLPLIPDAPAAPVVSTPHGPVVRRRILVIEDNVDAAETLRDVLEMNDQEVVVAHDGEDGIVKARALKPDVILCDIGLPGLSGYEVARRIRLDPTLAPTLIALTGYALADDQRKAFEAGFDHHLAKPFELAELERILACSAGASRRAL